MKEKFGAFTAVNMVAQQHSEVTAITKPFSLEQPMLYDQYEYCPSFSRLAVGEMSERCLHPNPQSVSK